MRTVSSWFETEMDKQTLHPLRRFRYDGTHYYSYVDNYGTTILDAKQITAGSTTLGLINTDKTWNMFLSDISNLRKEGIIDFALGVLNTIARAGMAISGTSVSNLVSPVVRKELNSWVEVAPKLGAETDVWSLAVFNGKLYGGTDPNGKLYEWNGTNAWVEVAPKLGDETFILSLAVFDNKLYGGTGWNGKLYEWNGTNAWVEKAPILGAETGIWNLAVFNGKLYGGTDPNGKLYEWDGDDEWVEVAPQLGAETDIASLAVFNGKLYGGTYPNGKLYEWDGDDEWVEVAPQLGDETFILSLVVFNSKLYGGTTPNGKLYEWNETDAWVEVAPKLGDETFILSLAVFNDKLYGGTANYGKLYEWNETDAWVEVAPKLGDEMTIRSLAVFNDKLYGGTANYGKLYEWRYIITSNIYIPRAGEWITFFTGLGDEPRFEGAYLNLQLRDKMAKMLEKKVGSGQGPVDYYTASYNPADLVWHLLVNYGELDSTASIANTDIDYTLWSDWWTDCDGLSLSIEAKLEGEHIGTVLETVAHLTHTMIFVRGDGKFVFYRYLPGEALVYAFDDDNTQNQEVKQTLDDLLNDIRCYYDYDQGQKTWAGSVTASDATSQTNYGKKSHTEEGAEEEERMPNVWHATQGSAQEYCNREIERFKDPRESCTFETGIMGFVFEPGDLVNNDITFWGYISDVFEVRKLEFDLNVGKTRVETLNVNYYVLGGFLLDDAYWGELDAAYNPLF